MKARTLLAGAVAVGAGALFAAGAGAVTKGRRFPIVRVNDAAGLQQAPGPFLTAAHTCQPDLAGAPNTTLAPQVLGASFDPSDFDEISLSTDGRMLAYASSVSSAGAPGLVKGVVIMPVGGAAIRVPAVGAGDNDQPSFKFDEFGYRCAFRSASGPGGAAPSNIQLYSLTLVNPTDTTATAAVTALSGTDSAFDPALAARVSVRDAGSGVHVRERDARIAFVSTGDLGTPGDNVRHVEQLFEWSELTDTFRQLTKHADVAAHVSRPTIAKSGELIVFESTANLVADAVDPLNSAHVGNPDHVRQLFRWRAGRGLDQLTWSDGDCFSPRFDPAGRFVLFSSRGDLLPGGNAGHNLEIFAWIPSAKAGFRLRQMTQTSFGDNVLPRPTSRVDLFTFYSTAHPPADGTGDVVAGFGQGLAECTPQALLLDRRRVFHVHGLNDLQNATRLPTTRTAGQQVPIITGPPATTSDGRAIFFATNDFALNPKPAKPSTTPPDEATILSFRIARATQR